MRQEDSQLNSILSKGCGCLFLLMFIGVVGAMIAHPSFLTSATKQSEVKQYVSSLNKGQQAYYAKFSAFSNSIPDLGLGIKTETTNYKYSTRATKQAAFNYGVSKQKELKSYVGGVFIVPAKEVDANAAKDEMATSSILCEADDRVTIEPAKPIYQNGKVICGKGTTKMTQYYN